MSERYVIRKMGAQSWQILPGWWEIITPDGDRRVREYWDEAIDLVLNLQKLDCPHPTTNSADGRTRCTACGFGWRYYAKAAA